MTQRSSTIPQPEVLISHAGFIRAVAQRLLLDDHEVDDVVQQTLLAALEKPPRRALKPWLAAVASNLARMRRRTEGRIHRREKVAARPESMTATSEIAERLETQRRLVEAVTSLDDPYRDVIVLRYFDELPPREVAAELNIPVETVRTRTRRALEQLRSNLDRHPGGRKGWQLALLPLALPPRAAQAAAGTAVAGIAGAIGMKSILAIAGALFAAVIFLLNETAAVNGDELQRTNESRTAEEPGSTLPGGIVETEEDDGPASREAPAAPRDFAFHAVVVDPQGEPVRGAKVVGKVRGHNRRDIDELTGADGEIELDGIGGDRDASLRIDHPEYIREFAFVPAWSDETVKVVLRRGSALKVRVLSPLGAPIADVPYKASFTQHTEGVWQYWNYEDEGKGDAEGVIEFGPMPRADLDLTINHPDWCFFNREFDAEDLSSGELTVRLRLGGTIKGVVLKPDGEPLEGAKVGCGVKSTRSGADGSFVLEHVSTYGETVQAEHPDYGPAPFGPAIGWRRNVPVKVADGGVVEGIEIRMVPATRARGRIVDDQGNPVPGFDIQCYCLGGYARGETTPKSAADGTFEAGPWNVTKPTKLLIQRTRTTTHRLPKELRLPIEPGQTLDVGDIVVQGRARLMVRVVMPDGSPVPPQKQAELGVTLTKRHEPRAWNDFLFASTSQLQMRPDGSCEASLDRAVFTLRARTKDGLYSEPLVIDTAKDALDVELRLKHAVAVSGLVVDGVGKPLRGRRVALLPVETAIPWAPGAAQRTVTNPEGRFELRVSKPGEYWIGFPQNASSLKQSYAKEPKPRKITVGTEAVEGVELVFGAQATDGGFIVRGRVVSAANGKPVANASYSYVRYRFLIPQHTLMTSSWDREGKFEADLETPGTYTCTIKADGFSSLTTSKFEVKKSGELDLGTIRLPAPLQLTGIAKDSQGVPVPYAQIHLLGAGGQQRDSVYTDTDGRFRIQNSDVGTFNVFAVSPRHPVAVMRGVAIKKGASNEIEIRMPDSSPLTVRVKDENGQPIEGAEFIYTFPAVAPFTSEEFGSYEPPSFGENKSDAEGVVRKPYMPAARLTLRIAKKGFGSVQRTIQIEKGKPTEIEVVLKRK
ncbi:MAG: sigma-70 family RNA polymerase sigma factor [Planctomycetota bacterium]|jgi:RNA polymerase sigma-70 factor (ECF subfamily)